MYVITTFLRDEFPLAAKRNVSLSLWANHLLDKWAELNVCVHAFVCVTMDPWVNNSVVSSLCGILSLRPSVRQFRTETVQQENIWL